jgi:hypothetical protein
MVQKRKMYFKVQYFLELNLTSITISMLSMFSKKVKVTEDFQ